MDDQNVTAETVYGMGGLVLQRIANNRSTGHRTTRYEYGVDLSNSAVAANDLVRGEVAPDSMDGSD